MDTREGGPGRGGGRALPKGCNFDIETDESNEGDKSPLLDVASRLVCGMQAHRAERMDSEMA